MTTPQERGPRVWEMQAVTEEDSLTEYPNRPVAYASELLRVDSAGLYAG